MKNILVPVDFSQPSREAFKVALDIAKRTKGKITMLHVIYLPVIYDTSMGGDTLGYNPILLDQMQKDATKELEKMKEESTGAVDINIELEFGDVVGGIKSNIEKFGSDMVIMGSSGMLGIPSFIVGSITEKIVRHSPVPVLAVRERFTLDSVKNIVLPSTLELNQSDFIKEAKKLQEFFKATLHILLINTPGKFMRDADAEEAFREFTRHYSLSNVKTYFRNYKNEDEGVLDFAHGEKMDLIAMGTHARKGLSHLFNGSITEDIVNEITIPMWTCHLKTAD